MADDDLNTALTPIERARIDAARWQEAREDASGTVSRLEEVRQAEQAVSETRRGLFADGVLGAVRSVPGAFEEAFDLIATMDEAMMKRLNRHIPDYRFGLDPRNPGTTDLTFFKLSPEESEQFPLQSLARPSERGLSEITNLFPETERGSGQAIEPVGKFLVGFFTGKKALQGANLLQGGSRVAVASNAFVAGAISDVAVFDGHEERLSNLIESVPALQNPVTEYLAASEDDGEIEGRIKNVLEGGAAGILFDTFLTGLRAVRTHRQAKAAEAAVDEVRNVETPLSEPPVRPEPVIKPGEELSEQLPPSEITSTVTKTAPVTDAVTPTKLEVVLKEGVVDVEATEAASAPLAEGFTRLYRAESPTVKFEDVFDSAKLDEFKNSRQLPGQRYTDSLDYADYFRATYGRDAEIKYIDVPTTSLDSLRINNNEFKVDLTAKPEAAPKASDNVLDEAVEVKLVDDIIRSDVSLSPDQAKALARAVKDGDESAASEALKDFNESTYDWQKIENGEDIKKILSVTEEVIADVVDEVKGGVQSNKQTKILAQQVGDNHTAESVSRLFRDVRGDKGIAARFYAAQRVMLASGNELRRMAEIAKKTKAPADEARLLHQVQVHAAVQAEVKGAQTEIARALQAMSVLKDSARENFKEFADLKRQFGGNSKNGQQFTKFMDDILDSHSLEDLNAKVRWTRWERAKMVFIEYTINSMLSSPKTHAINVMSNTLNTFLYSADRILGGAYRLLSQGDRAAWREARIDMVSKMTRLGEASKLARQAWRDGAPVTDKKQRIEFLTRQAIGMEGDSFLARAINLLGTIVRVPGRMLITGDEFFKAINRNAEIDVLAFRRADEEALAAGFEYGSKKYEASVARTVRELTDPDNMTNAAREIRGQAIEKSRLTTFQESARTNLGRGAERFVNANAAFKLIFAPFFRTPMNILRQGLLDRTPLGLITTAAREELRHGSPTVRAEAVARMSSGVAMMAGAWYLFGSDEDAPIQIVGKVPFDSSAKAANVKDYSIKLGDNWYQINRLDPLGMWLGLVADFKSHAEHNDNDEETFAFGQAAVAAFMNNVTNKTWAKSLADLMEMSEGISTNKPATIERAINRFTAGEFGKLIPQLFKSTSSAFVEDPTAAETWSVMDNLSRQLPVFNSDLPRRHDALGREIPLSAGVTAIFNPFATSATRDDPVDAEMFRLGFTIRPIQKTLGGGSVELTVEEYSKLTGELMRRTGVHEILSALIQSDGWSDLPDHLKIVVMKERITEARTAARGMLLGETDVARRFSQAKADAALLLTSED